ncbi:MAG: tRNA-dihydrouridine synthase family protein [Lentisphaeria bacterium]
MNAAKKLYPPTINLLAPLAGYTDLAFRRACRKYGCYYAFTPLVEAGSVVYGRERTSINLLRGEEEPWLGLQLLGAKPQLLEEAARRISDLPFDVIDFNMGCPVRKVTKRGGGAAMCENSDLAVRCIASIAQQVDLPVTAKIRVLDYEDPEPTVALAKELYEAGIAALTIHGRTVDMVYSGSAAVNVIAAVRQALPIPVIANGGVVDVASARRLRESTGCSRIMIARGAIGNPWIFKSLQEGKDWVPTSNEICRVLEEHVAGIVELYGENSGLRYARKIISSYLCGRGYRRTLRARVTSLVNMAQFNDFLQEVKVEGPQK